jgi:hypothetical protein
MADDHLRGVRLPPELQGVPGRPLEVYTSLMPSLM